MLKKITGVEMCVIKANDEDDNFIQFSMLKS